MLDGVPTLDGSGDSMLEHLLDVIDDTLKSIPASRRRDGETVREAVRRAVRSRVENIWGKRPITKVLLTQLNARG
jgi:ribonuclease J